MDDVGKASNDETIWVIPEAAFTGKFIFGASQPIPFDEFIADKMVFRPKKRKEQREDHAVDPAWERLVQDEYPWFTADDIRAAMEPSKPPRRARGADADNSASEENADPEPAAAEGLPEDLAAEAVERLQEFREQWRWGHEELYAHYYVLDRGGLDCVACYPRKRARPWSIAHGAGAMHSFAFATHGLELSHLLAREWCAKQNFYYQMHIDRQDDDGFDFEAAPPYQLSEEFWAALRDVPADSPTFVRFKELAEWFPRMRA